MSRSAQTSAMVSLSPGRSAELAVMPTPPRTGPCPGVAGDRGASELPSGLVRWSWLGFPVFELRICGPFGWLSVHDLVHVGQGGLVALVSGAQLGVHPGHDGPGRGPACVLCLV